MTDEEGTIKAESHLHRLFAELLGGNNDAVREMEALIRELQAAPSTAWHPKPPDTCEYARVPHC